MSNHTNIPNDDFRSLIYIKPGLNTLRDKKNYVNDVCSNLGTNSIPDKKNEKLLQKVFLIHKNLSDF